MNVKDVKTASGLLCPSAIKNTLLGLSIALFSVSCSNDVEDLMLDVVEAQTEVIELAYPDETGVIKEGYLGVMPITYCAIHGECVAHGDIILDKSKITEEPQRLGNLSENYRSVGRTSGRWPDGVVYYNISSSLSNTSRVTNAIAHWEANTNLRFVQRTNQSNYITFRSGSGCSSSVGMVGGQQFINLASSCSTGNTIHEIGHAVGLWHEHTRSDRDSYVDIYWDRIGSNASFNFRTYTQTGSDGAEYTNTLDFGSVMMYGSYAFSNNGQPTITKKDGSTFSVQRNGLSAQDIQGLNIMYPGDNSTPSYTNGQWYTIDGLRVYRYNDKWYWNDGSGWREVVNVNGVWYFA